MTEKRPRDYAAEIVQLTTRQERRAALGRVPEHLQAMTRQHVITYFALHKRANNK